MLFQTAVAALIGAAIVAMLRWMRRRSRIAASLVEVGLLARAMVGLALFWISYLHLPIGTSLQFGDGFWVLASDAPAYYNAALAAPAWGLRGSQGPTRAYERVLAFWMHVVGQSPAAGLYLNLLLFVATAAAVLAVVPTRNDWRRDAPVLICLAALSFNPTLVGHATQPLKDTFMALAVVMGCASAYVLFNTLHAGADDSDGLRRFVMSIIGVLVAMYLVSGIRPYFGFVEWGCYLLAALVSCILVAGGRLRMAAVHALTLLALWSAMASGGANYYQEIMRRTVRASTNPVVLFASGGSLLQEAQSGFVRTTSGTNAAAPQPAVSEGNAMPGVQLTDGWNVRKGLILMFVPVVVARPMGLLRLEGGRGLLAAADIDTVFVDASMLFVLLLCIARRTELRRNLPYFSFAMFIAVVSAGLVAYVVTNLGALLRLRLLFGVPLWMTAMALVPLAYTDGPRRDATPDDVVAVAERGMDRR